MNDQESNQLIGQFPSVPKQERAYQKRQALLESGRILFIEKGFDHTTAKEIAAHANVATGTFYRYFCDKRQLLMALIKDQLERFMPPRPSWLNHNDPETELAEQLASHYDRLEKLGLHRVLPELLPHDPELTEVFGEARRKLHGSIYEGLKQAKDLGFTWNDLDLWSVAWSIIVLTENIPKMDIKKGTNSDYHVVAKIICRSVFPPDVLVQLKSGEKSF
ncbi:TetR/AcrR family transcriptional regulator [Mesobacillus maritimus]|uniref:TetR/AcrR family transcriptional regulator n=1 Tax=Mesobacillus maritimus TaxID=1643336 RepID=A0ABS7K8Q1_9BACI|nr:TetR/AcrR family transcriptional regulator [Mesobacillus maritimus]MBY0098646.1 TetR/AcrR family transcriptional regulator [Mesobacillus maritimus]